MIEGTFSLFFISFGRDDMMYGRNKDSRIDFIPLKTISKTFKNGVTRVLFVPGESYIGIKYADGTIVGKSPLWPEFVKLDERDIEIESIS